ncbi:uncharacterized protein EV154DRAFT_580930 [Mucor mucedo]|uniref:uncharacterized protein n=1 Tax=Mucor mucedo TaxID=29922 RepID=UPI002220C190|nr:uncharacterized protein EV154DRAFT_580930 [Mucor mucedo]KAI7894021.1 hypothetical protein EV154DRAFT_580930 [Mucor mucedo]
MKTNPQAKRNATKLYEKVTKNNNVETHLQAFPCTSPPYNQFDMICNSCLEEQPCSFIGLRLFDISTIDGGLVYGPYFPDTKKDDILRSCRSRRFNRKPYSPGAKNYASNQIRSTLRRVLKLLMDARPYYNDEIIQQYYAEGYKHLCDTCSTSIFDKHYICASCGMEICIACYDDLRNKIEGAHTHPKSADNKHARAEFILFSKSAKKSNSALIDSTISEDGRSLMHSDKMDNYQDASPMVTTSLDTSSIGDQYDNSYINAATGSNNQLPGDANSPIGCADNLNSPYVYVNEPRGVVTPTYISSPHSSQSTVTDQSLYFDCDNQLPPLTDIAPGARQSTISSSNSIGSDRSNVTSFSPTFRDIETSSSIDLDSYSILSVNDGVGSALWNQLYRPCTRADILDNVQTNLSTYDNNLLQPVISPDEVYEEPMYYAKDEHYSLFDYDWTPPSQQVDYISERIQWDYSDFYGDYFSHGYYNADNFEFGQNPIGFYYPNPQAEYLVSLCSQRYTSADLRDGSVLYHDALDVKEELL